MASLGLCSSCQAQDGVKILTPQEFDQTVKSDGDAVILDVRQPSEYAEGHLQGALLLNVLDEAAFDAGMQKLDKTKTYYIYCRSGRRSHKAAVKMQEKGFKVFDMKGGIIGWKEAGLPVVLHDAAEQETDSFKTRSGKDVVITPIKHASMRISCGGREIEVDPVTALPPKTDYSKMPKADYILITHEHDDHCDLQAVKALSKENTRVIANPNTVKLLGVGEEIRKGGKMKLADDITVEAVAAYNTSRDKLKFHPKGRDNGYILTLDGLRIYIAGDTEPIEEMKSIKNIDVAFLPCNLPYTMTPQQMAEAARTIKPKVLYPYHYGETKIEEVTRLLAGSGIEVRIRHFQ